jgi:AcrR family transcriptional regulator
MARQPAKLRRDEILRVTLEQVTQRGLAETRVADVASALGVSTALVFYHFETKDRLLSDAFAFAAQRDLERLAGIVASHAGAWDRLSRILALYSPGPSTSPSWPLWIEAWAAALRSPPLQAVSRRLDMHWKNTVAEVIAEGVASGEFRCDDESGAAWRITALVDGLAVQSTVHKGVVSRATMRQWIRQVAAHELGIDDSSDQPADPRVQLRQRRLIRTKRGAVGR